MDLLISMYGLNKRGWFTNTALLDEKTFEIIFQKIWFKNLIF